MLDFKTEVYPEILNRLAQNKRYFTKTDNNPNHVIVQGDIVNVRTMKSSPDYLEVPYNMFEKTWQVLQEKGRVSQSDLSRAHNVKRSAFMLIAFDLLDEIKYKELNNSITIKK